MIQIHIIPRNDDGTIKEECYDMLCAWWNAHGMVAPKPYQLAKLGIIASVDGTPAAALWLYMANCSGVCFLHGYVTNPALKAKRGLLDTMVDYMQTQAKLMDYGLMYGIAPQQGGLKRVLSRLGFQKGDNVAHIHLVKILTQNP